MVIQDATGGHILNLTGVHYSAEDLTLSKNSDDKNILSFIYDNTGYHWNKGGPYNLLTDLDL